MKTQKQVNFIQKTLFGLLLIGLLVFTTFAQGNDSLVIWSASEINQTIGNGITSPTEVKLRVTRPFTKVHISPVPELQKFITVEPSYFAHLRPDTEYTVKISYSLHGGVAEGIYEGSIRLRSLMRTISQSLKAKVVVNYGGNITSSSVVTLSNNSLQLISGADPNGRGLSFSQPNPELSQILPGAILALPPSPSIPNGFFGKVTGISTSNNQLFVATTEASLSEAFMKASVNIDRALTAEDLSLTDDLTEEVFPGEKKSKYSSRLTAADNGFSLRLEDYVMYQAGAARLAVDANMTVSPNLRFSFDVDNFRLKQLAFTIALNQSSDLKLKIQVNSNFLEAEKEVLRRQLNPIVVWVGVVPVVIVPEISFVARIEGNAAVGVEFGIRQTSNVTVGATYANANWNTIADFSGSFSANPPTPSAGVNIKGQIGPRFKLLLYGVVGPRADVGPFGELDVDLLRTPLWKIFGGIEANAGVRLQIFDKTLADQEFPGLIQHRRLIAEGGSSSNSIQWLNFIEGNPGVPGDGVFVNATGGSLDINFDLSSPIPLNQFTNGFTISVFTPDLQNISSSSFTIIAPNRTEPCTLHFGGLGRFPIGTTIVNGVQGKYANIFQSDIQGVVNFANTTRPGCNFTVNDLYLGKIYLNSNVLGQFITRVDAVSIGSGLNNYPR